MSNLKNNFQINENLDRFRAFRMSDDFNWQVAEYSKWVEIISEHLEAPEKEVPEKNVNINFRISSWPTRALVAAMLLSQQQINGVSAMKTENFQVYSNCSQWILEAEKLKSLQSSGRIQFPEVDIMPIDVGEESETKSAENDTLKTEVIFNGLAKKWKSETRGQSSVSRIIMHPSYLAIIGLGKEALPFILKDLQRETNHWFTALRAISKVESSPVRPEDAGDLKKMTLAWLKWGKENGYLG